MSRLNSHAARRKASKAYLSALAQHRQHVCLGHFRPELLDKDLDGLVADDGCGLVEEGVEEDALEGVDDGRGELVVEGETLSGEGAEEEAASR